MLTSDLALSVQRRAAVPNAQVTFSSADFYALIDEEIESKLIPLVLKNLEEYYVADFPYNITANQNQYQIPTRAIAGKLRDVQIISSSDSQSISPLERLDITDLYASTSSSSRVRIKKNGFYIKGNSIYMYPTPTSTQNIINLEYYIRPNASVDPSVCAAITAFTSTTITVSSLPANITVSTPVDLVKVNSGFECTAIDQTITGIASNVLTFASLPTNLTIGDYVCQAKQSCVVQVPQELLPLLSQYVVVRVLAAQGDGQALQMAMSELQKLEDNANILISPRVDGKLKRVVNTRGVSRFV
ncbi:MAG: hypothetical protein NVSMB70_05440 [Chamaesiphon sp.]